MDKFTVPLNKDACREEIKLIQDYFDEEHGIILSIPQVISWLLNSLSDEVPTLAITKAYRKRLIPIQNVVYVSVRSKFYEKWAAIKAHMEVYYRVDASIALLAIIYDASAKIKAYKKGS